MPTPMVDYRDFSLSRRNDPQFSHLKLLLGWPIYFALYVLTETLIPVENCHPMHCWLDDVIPFWEGFLIPYVFWYFLIVISLGYFLLYDVGSFKKLQIFIIITQAVAMLTYILYPSCQDLRPVVFPRDNLLTDGVALLYAVDTNTGVCPSLHVAYSLGIASVWLKRKSSSVGWKCFVVVAVISICLSTMFIKQHSAVDVFAAVILCFFTDAIVFGPSYWLPKLGRSR